VAYFTDTIITKIDAKGRVSVPLKFRQVLEKEEADSFFLIPSIGHNALEGFGPTAMREFQARLEPLDRFSDESDALALSFFADSAQLFWDGDNRVKIPESLLDHAKIAGDILFAGMGAKFQVWEPEAYKAWRARALDIARAKRGSMTGGAPA
jgi:MraZ protein